MKYFYVASAQYFSLSFVTYYTQSGFGTKILRQKGKKQVKLYMVHSNTTRIIYKYGKNIDVIKELKMRTTEISLKKHN